MSEIPNDPELNAIASALGGLSPVPSRLDRDRLMFQAGALSRVRSDRARWTWPSVAAMLALIVTAESAYLATRPATRVVERLLVIREPSSPPSESTSTPTAPIVILRQSEAPTAEALPSRWESISDYQRGKDLVLRFGLDAFPEPVRLSSQAGGVPDPSEEVPMSAGALRRIELERLINPGDHS